MATDTTPQPDVWPECPTCGAAYVLRRSFVVGTRKGQPSRWEWLFARDCRHRTEPIARGADG